MTVSFRSVPLPISPCPPKNRKPIPSCEPGDSRCSGRPRGSTASHGGVQLRLNALLPEQVHQAITTTIRQTVRGVLFGSTHTTRRPLVDAPLATRETEVRARIRDYRTMATAEGAATGAGGFLLGLADFPLLPGFKLRGY